MMRKLYFARVSPHLHVPAEGPECGGARPLRVRDRRGGGRCRRVMVRTASSQSLDICDLMPRYRDGMKITVEEGRVEIVVEGKKRKLIFKDTHLEDAGEITCKTNRDSSSCILKVARKHQNILSFSVIFRRV